MQVKRSDLTVDKYGAPDGKLLIEPFKYMTRTVTTTEFVPIESKEGEDPTKTDEAPMMEPKQVKTKAPYEVQLAKVVSAGTGAAYAVGDVVTYSIKFVKEFDLFKDTFLVSGYDLYGKYAL